MKSCIKRCCKKNNTYIRNPYQTKKSRHRSNAEKLYNQITAIRCAILKAEGPLLDCSPGGYLPT